MALLIFTSESQDDGRRQRFAYCYDGAERWLEFGSDGRLLIDAHELASGHAVPVEGHTRVGWYLRGDRLPICPLHRRDGDVPLLLSGAALETEPLRGLL